MLMLNIDSTLIQLDFDNTLTSADLAPNSVDSSELVDGSIDASHISANAVTIPKLKEENITQSAIKRTFHKSWILGS